MNDESLVSKMEGKPTFRGTWNSLMAWPNWPRPPDFTTDLRCCGQLRLRTMGLYRFRDRRRYLSKIDIFFSSPMHLTRCCHFHVQSDARFYAFRVQAHLLDLEQSLQRRKMFSLVRAVNQEPRTKNRTFSAAAGLPLCRTGCVNLHQQSVQR